MVKVCFEFATALFPWQQKREYGLPLAGFGSLQGLSFYPAGGGAGLETRRGSGGGVACPRTPLVPRTSNSSRPLSAVFSRMTDVFSQVFFVVVVDFCHFLQLFQELYARIYHKMAKVLFASYGCFRVSC